MTTLTHPPGMSLPPPRGTTPYFLRCAVVAEAVRQEKARRLTPAA